jgi:hypothetical protein
MCAPGGKEALAMGRLSVISADSAKILPNSYKNLNTRRVPAAVKIFKFQEVGYNVKYAFFLCTLPVLPARNTTRLTIPIH